MDSPSTPHTAAPCPSGERQTGIMLSSAYLAPVHYYAYLYRGALAQARPGTERYRIVEEQADHYVKQTYRNRCIIAADDGPVALTVPVSAPCATPDAPAPALSKTPMHDVVVSDHGNWRHQHWQAIVSAYRSSPYFEYYADELSAVFHAGDAAHNAAVDSTGGDAARLVDFNAALRDWVLSCLDLHPVIEVSRERYVTPAELSASTDGAALLDLRETIRPKIPYSTDTAFRPVAYYQVFRQRHGFLPNMSILDLLFNMGPESRIVLRDSITGIDA